MNFFTLQRNVERVVDNFTELVLDSAMAHSDVIADLNVQQLEEGKRIDGNSIIPEYQSDVYAKAKKSIGAKPPIGTPDLKLTGSFHSGIYADKRGSYIYTYSSDEKADRLNAKYRKIFGLTFDSKIYFKPILLDELLKRTRDELHKG